MTTALVLVSHVAEIAEGVRRLAAQMAPDVPVAVAGGDDDGGVGTSLDRVLAALAEAADAAGSTVVLYDLGSALLITETALEMTGSDDVEIVDAPLVEGALAAAAAAQQGGDRVEVARAARAQGPAGAPPDAGAPGGPAVEPGADATVRTLVLRNALGLHARPAADLARSLTRRGATVLLSRPSGSWVDARSVVAVIGLGLRGGDEIRVAAEGPDASAVLADVDALVASGFGETESGDAPGSLSGVAAAPGTAAGPAVLVHAPAPPEPAAPGPVEDERRRLAEALTVAATALGSAAGPFRAIAAAHRALLGDPMLAGRARDLLADGGSAVQAWCRAVDEARTLLSGAGDAQLADRAVDVVDVGARVTAALLGAEHRAGLPAPDRLRDAVVVTDELLPSQVVLAAQNGTVALVAARGGETAHAAQLARALAVPAVVGVGTALLGVADGAELRVDGSAGRVDWG